jgi:septum formation protein
MLLDKIKEYKLILATQSPRRHYLMKEVGFNFEIIIPDNIEEVYPETLSEMEVPAFLADLKASWFEGKLTEKEIVITADTIVAIEGHVLGKPANFDEAVAMLKMLSGKCHDVVTSVCILSKNKKKIFSNISRVFFKKLTEDEILYYVNQYKPYDKAGAYGAQEWIGYIGIDKIEGTYFNVMGLPIHMLYNELEKFIS